MAHAARLAIALITMALAGWSWLVLSGWIAWAVFIGIALVGSVVAAAVFRRLATPEIIRADLEDRVRNPPL